MSSTFFLIYYEHGGNYTNFASFAATVTVLCKAAIDRGVRLSTGRQLKTIKFDGKCASLVCDPTFWVFKPFLE